MESDAEGIPDPVWQPRKNNFCNKNVMLVKENKYNYIPHNKAYVQCKKNGAKIFNIIIDNCA